MTRKQVGEQGARFARKTLPSRTRTLNGFTRGSPVIRRLPPDDVEAPWAGSKSEFMAVMSHELRTPMTGVLGMIELLAEAKDPQERDRYLAALRQSADAVMTVLDRLLEASLDQSRGTAAGPSPIGPRRTLNILVAEDNEISQLLIATLMRRKGHRVTCVDNGWRAVEAAAVMPFDCILMDLQMPEMDGIEATRTIRESAGPNARIPIIAITADALPERRRQYETVGLTQLLTKPIDNGKLNDAIDAIAFAPAVAEPRSNPTPAIDLAHLGEVHSAIGSKKVCGLLELACAELVDRPNAIRRLLGGDLIMLRREAHSFKGAVSSVGLVAVAHAAKAVELALPGAELEHSLDRLETEASRALLAVKSFLAADCKGLAAGA